MKTRGQRFQRALAALAIMTVLLTGERAVGQRSPLAFESRSLGQGWFEYSVITTDDPFFLFLDVMGAGVSFGPIADAGPLPVRWTNMLSADERSFWAFDGIGMGEQARPYRVTFRLRSAQTSFKRIPGGVVTMSLAIVGGYHGHLASANIVGYWIPDVLVPCPPEEADGSATNLWLWCPMIRDLPQPRIVKMIETNGVATGVAFEYPEQSTVRLEGTRDFQTWTNIASIFGSSGVSTWTTNSVLQNYGDFFRLRLVAEGWSTNLPPLSVAASTKAADPISGPIVLLNPATLRLRSSTGEKVRVATLDGRLRRTERSALEVGSEPVATPRRKDQSLGFFQLREDL